MAIIGCVSGFPTLTIQVSESGADYPACGLSEPYACKTLAYLLNQMKKASYSSAMILQLFINVMYNQTITQTTLEITLHFEHIHRVGVVGFNNAFINFEQAGSSIQISQLNYDDELYWSWTGLGFAWAGEFTVSNIPQINMSPGIQQVVFDACTFISVSLFVEKYDNVVIKNNTFGNSAICSCVTLAVHHLATIENNTFENCRLVHRKSLLDIQLQKSPIKIVNNSFLNLKAKGFFRTSVISIIGDAAGILIQNNQFVGSTMSLIAIHTKVDNKALIGNPCIWYTVQKNNFRNNYNDNILTKIEEPILVSIKTGITTSVCSMELSFNQNLFVNNTHTHLLSAEVGDKNHLYNSSTVNITALSLLNNAGTSWLVMIECNGRLYQSIWINMAVLRVENNTVWYNENDASHSLIVHVRNVNKSIIRDSTFRRNLGTPLVFENENLYTHLVLCVIGDLRFQQNNAIYGGAMSLNNVIMNSSCQSTITFERNFGRYGGALYVNNILRSGIDVCNTTLEFLDNRAVILGDAVYVQSFSSDLRMILNECSRNLSKKEVASSAANITALNLKDNCLSIFPGQNILLNISIIDYYGMPSLCTADVSILCNDSIYNCRYHLFIKDIKLYGPDSVILVQLPKTNSSIINTNLRIQSPINTDYRNISLRLSCKNSNTSIKFKLNISSCPEGFLYDLKLKMCKCAAETQHTSCSTVLGAVCVAHGYWYGLVQNEYIVTHYKYSNSKIRNSPCPSGMQSGKKYFLLSGTQCSNGRGGVLCRTCTKNFAFSFLAIHCISKENCSSFKAIALLSTAILFQILITVFLVLVIKFKHHLGCGFLYGPMLFLAVVNHIPLDVYSECFTLSTAVSIITSVALLNLELFGRIPWCFFESIPKLYNYSLRVLGPLIVLLVLLVITALARWHPKCSLLERGLQRRHASHCTITISTLKGMCILMMLSFWSLADISINILTPTVLETHHYSMYMVSIQPDIAYFSSQHLPMAIPALLVLLVVILPLVIILLSAPFLQR